MEAELAGRASSFVPAPHLRLAAVWGQETGCVGGGRGGDVCSLSLFSDLCSCHLPSRCR